MKRDMQVVKKVLEYYETSEKGVPDGPDEIIDGHKEICIDAGFITECIEERDGCWRTRLTWKGHNFLYELRKFDQELDLHRAGVK